MARKTAATTTPVIAGETVRLTRKRVRNINLRILADGSIAISAPPEVSLATIEAFVSSRRTWIEEARARLARRSATQGIDCSEGSDVMVWGRPRRLQIVAEPASGRSPRCRFELGDDVLSARIDERIAGGGDEALRAREAALDAWLRDLLRQEVDAILPTCESVVGRRSSTLRLRCMSSRWGSCNVRTATITLNTKLVHYHPRCLRSVLVHELCHLHEPSHNERFHTLMDRFCPDWREARAELEGRL